MTMQQKENMRHGFSLVELSIVLVILGLLVGGILAGQSLIRAAELRAVSAEATRYTTATASFRDKYFAIPGDMNNATKFWGRLNSDADCVTNSSPAAAVTTPGACDGNGSGGIDGQNYEPPEFWRHLALAGLIEGTYSGVMAGVSQWNCTIGTTCPRSKLSGGAWMPDRLRSYAGDTGYFKGEYGNNLAFGTNTAMEYPNIAVLKPEEAWNIDSKMDDGKPGTGKVMAIRWATCTNAASMTDVTTTYKLDSTAVACALSFNSAF